MRIKLKQKLKLTHRFVETMPENLESGILYISMKYSTVAHKCCCGCGNEVITPITPTDWKLLYNGESISLDPSIGNWNFECKSHYWIKNSLIHWAAMWTDEEIQTGRIEDLRKKGEFFASKSKQLKDASNEKKQSTFLKRLISIFKK